MHTKTGYLDLKTGTRYKDYIHYLDTLRKVQQLNLRETTPSSSLDSLVSSFEHLKKHASSFAAFEDWVLEHQELLARGVADLKGKPFKPSKAVPYWSAVSATNMYDAPTPTSELPYTSVNFSTRSHRSYRLYNVMIYIGAEYYKNQGPHTGSDEFTGAYHGYFYAKDWAFSAARCLFALIQEERGIEREKPKTNSIAALSPISEDSTVRESIARELLGLHFPKLSYNDFSHFGNAGLFPDTVEEFCAEIWFYNQPALPKSTIILPTDFTHS